MLDLQKLLYLLIPMFKIYKQYIYIYCQKALFSSLNTIGHISIIIYTIIARISKEKFIHFISKRPNLETKLLEYQDYIKECYSICKNFYISTSHQAQQIYNSNIVVHIRSFLKNAYYATLKHIKYFYIKSKKIKLYKLRTCIILASLCHFSIIITILITSHSYKLSKKMEPNQAQNFVIIDSVHINNYSNFLTELETTKEKQYSTINTTEEYHHPTPIKSPQQYKECEYTITKKHSHTPPPKTTPMLKKTQKEIRDNIIGIPQKKPQKSAEIATSVLKSIEGHNAILSSKPQEPIKSPKEKILFKGKTDNIYNESAYISATVIESIRGQFLHCWTIPSGGEGVEFIKVNVLVSLDTQANVKSIKLLNEKHYKKNPYYKVMSESVIRAIHKCSPLNGLKPESYKQWQEIEMTFDPINMF